FADGHVLLEGVPGLGKTYLVKVLSQVLELTSGRVQCTPDLMPADVLGTHIVGEDEHGRRSFRFEKGPVFHNRAAQGRAIDMAAQLGFDDVVPVVKEVVGAEGLVAVGPVHHTVGGVAAALGHQLHLGGGRAALVGVVVGGGDAELRQGSLGGADGAGEGEAVLGVVDVHAVEGDVGLVAAGAVDAAAAAIVVHNAAVAAGSICRARNEGHAGHQAQQARRVKAGAGKVQ
ncbi:MAG: AAA family ATPase, partial [Acidobacteria bacterium]|nr:AAA family ATPase [Acidobacteriota bacterium]